MTAWKRLSQFKPYMICTDHATETVSNSRWLWSAYVNSCITYLYLLINFTCFEEVSHTIKNRMARSGLNLSKLDRFEGKKVLIYNKNNAMHSSALSVITYWLQHYRSSEIESYILINFLMSLKSNAPPTQILAIVSCPDPWGNDKDKGKGGSYPSTEHRRRTFQDAMSTSSLVKI